MRLVALTPADVVSQWAWLRSGIQSVIAKTRAKFLPEDVYLSLRTNAAWAFALRDGDGDDFGFMVVQNEHDPDGLVLFVWCLWCEPAAGAKHKDAIYAELESLARQAKAVRIRAHSPRIGWQREGFFNATKFIYEREVTNGQQE